VSHLRVIAGKAKGRRLEMVPGEGTRPIMDRVKEALFNILGASIHGAVFLDLFAGTGSVGIEALSRGAAKATFVDRSARAIRTIQANLAHTRLTEWAEVTRADVATFLSTPVRERYDFVYVAPPQYKGLWKETLLKLDAMTGLLNPDALVVAQIDPKEIEELPLHTLAEIDRRRYGQTMLVFYENSGG